MLARAVAPRPSVKATRVSVSEDGRYAVGPSLDSISPYVPWLAGVTADTALNLITIYQCVRVLSNTFAQLPLMLYRRRADGGKERAVDHPLYRTLHLSPNPDLTSFAWRRMLMTHIATWGDHFVEKIPDQAGRTLLYPVRPDRVEVTRKDGRKHYWYLSPEGGRKEFPEGRLIQISGLSTDGLRGRSPINDLRSTIRLAKTAETFGDSFFRNGARPATVLKHPETLSTDAIRRLREQMDELRGSGNAGKTVVLEEGLDFSEVGIPPDDAQFMETRLFQKRELAGAYGIPPHMIGDLERATFSNIEHQSLELITVTMMPYFVNVEQELSVQLIDDDDYFVEFLVDGYLRGDAKTRNQAYAIRWQHGSLNANEWRIKENDNPVDGGDTYYVPVNYQPAVATAALDQPESTDDDETEEADESFAPRVGAPVLRRVKSVEVRCPNGHLLAESATAPYRIKCNRGRCDTVAEAS